MKVKEYALRLDVCRTPFLAETGIAYKVDGRRVFDEPCKLADFFGDTVGIRQAANEHVYIACLDTKLHMVGCFEASHGAVNMSIFPVREIFQKALMIGAISIVICHNHPSGDTTPSPEDVSATRRVKEAGDIIGINVADHIIVGAGSREYYSFSDSSPVMGC